MLKQNKTKTKKNKKKKKKTVDCENRRHASQHIDSKTDSKTDSERKRDRDRDAIMGAKPCLMVLLCLCKGLKSLLDLVVKPLHLLQKEITLSFDGRQFLCVLFPVYPTKAS